MNDIQHYSCLKSDRIKRHNLNIIFSSKMTIRLCFLDNFIVRHNKKNILKLRHFIVTCQYTIPKLSIAHDDVRFFFLNYSWQIETFKWVNKTFFFYSSNVSLECLSYNFNTLSDILNIRVIRR
jgi:hypothetical protein